jgi:hypothetical protein
VVGEICCELVKRPNVFYASDRLWIQPVIYVIEVNKREVLNIEEIEIKRTNIEHGTTEIGLRVGSPGNTLIM